jgi:hypothetical protein
VTYLQTTNFVNFLSLYLEKYNSHSFHAYVRWGIMGTVIVNIYYF